VCRSGSCPFALSDDAARLFGIFGSNQDLHLSQAVSGNSVGKPQRLAAEHARYPGSFESPADYLCLDLVACRAHLYELGLGLVRLLQCRQFSDKICAAVRAFFDTFNIFLPTYRTEWHEFYTLLLVQKVAVQFQ